MTPWDLVVWGIAVGVAAVPAGLGVAIAIAMIGIARGKL